MRLFWKILFTIPLASLLLSLLAIGMKEITKKGLLGAFEPMSKTFGIPPITIITMCIIIASIYSFVIMKIFKELLPQSTQPISKERDGK